MVGPQPGALKLSPVVWRRDVRFATADQAKARFAQFLRGARLSTRLEVPGGYRLTA